MKKEWIVIWKIKGINQVRETNPLTLSDCHKLVMYLSTFPEITVCYEKSRRKTMKIRINNAK